MTKKERESLERAETAARINRALRWSDATEIAPDVPVPTGGQVATGWHFNAYTGRLEHLWSDSTSHGNMPLSNRSRTGTQNGRRLYSTKVLALRALRCVVERQSAERLAAIDAQIEAEAGEEGKRP